MSVPEYEDILRLVDPDMVPQQPTVCLAYASWCPHCKSMRPEFEKFIKLARDELPQLQILVVESEDAAMRKFSSDNKITGFPTVMMFNPPSKRWERWADFPSPARRTTCSRRSSDTWPGAVHQHRLWRLPAPPRRSHRAVPQLEGTLRRGGRPDQAVHGDAPHR